MTYSSTSPQTTDTEGRGLDVLVVDDDHHLLRTLTDILRRKGYLPQTAASGGESLEWLEHTRAAPAIALVDLSLPDMDGIELVHRLRRVSDLTEVVILTGNASLDTAVAALREQSYDYLLKPVPPDRLLDTMRRAGDRWRRRRAERSLRRSEERFRRVVESISDAVLVLDREGTVRYANRRLETDLGIAPGEAVGARVLSRVHPDDLDEARRLLASSETEVAELRLRRSDGTWRWFACRTAVLIDSTDGLVLAAHDITDRRLLETQARQAQRLDSVGRLAGGVAHDFNNLLTVVLGHCQLGLADPDLPPRLRETLTAIHDAGEKGAALTRQLLSFARRQPAAARVLDLNEIVRGFQPLLRGSLGGAIEVTYEIAAAPVLVHADPVQLEQVLMNLVFNARDAMPEGGTLSIGTRTQTAAQQPSDAFGTGAATAVLVVRDTGVGMDATTRERLFEPFFTTKAQGTGLGLATVYGIVHQAGGQIVVASVAGAGTTFEVHLPLTAPPTFARQPLLRGGDGETVLVVDDDAAVRDVARRLLEARGYRVRAAASGAEALALVAAGEPADVVLADMVMPEMGGQELAAALAATHPRLPVLLMSGYAPSGQGPVLAKPLSSVALVAAVREALDSRAV